VLDGIMCFGALAMMLLYAPPLAVLTMVGVVLYALIRWVSYTPFREAHAERLVLGARESTHFLETMRAIQPLKLFGREAERAVRWKNLRVDVQNRDIETTKMGIGFGLANTAIFGLLGIGTFYWGAQMVMGGINAPAPFTVGMLFAFTSYQGQFTSRIAGLIDFFVQWRMLSLHTERLGDIVLTPPERDGVAKAEGVADQESRSDALLARIMPPSDLAHLQPSVELRDVSFRYGAGERWVLRGVNLRIDAGESVAIVGASGGGKSTLLKILLGLLEPTEGEVLYGGVPIKSLGLANVRKRFGTVMQDDVLLSGSLMDNICFFDLQPNTVRAQACCELAQIHEEIVRMPMGYHTLVGDLGSGLSGGQKQRVLLARALYKAPKVLALDEATSHLDLANERSVTAALARMNLTRIIVAHRPETIAGAKRVVAITDGQAREVVREVAREPGRGSGHAAPQATP
jgi:ATP-binding cassette, subfamily B, bacterial CvaB/MchF/RaxB